MFFLGSIFFTTFYIFFYGKIINIYVFKNNKLSLSEIGIYGSIFLSFLALFINFVFPLNKLVCTIVFIAPLLFIFKKNFISKNDVIFILIASILTALILAYSKINTPDAVLKFPEKIITGINIIDDLLFWTDGVNEPRKININTCKKGTADIFTHTQLTGLDG